MTKLKNIISRAFSRKLGAAGTSAFCNIAEGTHAGNVTMLAGEDIETSNLIVKTGVNGNEIMIANATDKPLGVCDDQGHKGDVLNVKLAGSAESTFMCVCSSGASFGDVLYTSANGKVSTIPAGGAYKVGIALCDCAANGVVEVDPQGFGSKAWQIADCGVFEWTGSSTNAEMIIDGASTSDIAFANVINAANTEKSVRVSIAEGKLTFTLDAVGTEGTTKISWILIRKN